MKPQVSQTLTDLLIQVSQKSPKNIFDFQIDGKKASEHLKEVMIACDEKKSPQVEAKKKIVFHLKKNK